MTDLTDFSPILDEGVFQERRRWWRFGKRSDGPKPLTTGTTRVFRRSDGTLVADGKSPATSEKYWQADGGWVTVDTGEHVLKYSFPYADSDGLASYVITVTVNVQVVDAAEVVTRSVRNVRPVLEPALGEAIASAARDAASCTSGDDAVGRRHAARCGLEDALRTALQSSVIPSTPWLRASTLAVTVDFDSRSAAFVDQATETVHAGELLGLTAANEIKKADHEIGLRDKWRAALSPYLSDPALRTIEMALRDPSDANVQKVVDALNLYDMKRLELAVEAMGTLVDGNLIVDFRDVKNVEILFRAVQAWHARPIDEPANADGREAIDVMANTADEPAHRPEPSVWGDD